MATVEIVDRSEMIGKMKALLEINPKETAIVTVDMHRGHLDPAVATMPAPSADCERVIRATERLLQHARGAGVHVIHVVTVQRLIPGLGAEGRACPFWAKLSQMVESDRWIPGKRSTLDEHNIEGSILTQIIPALYDKERDYVVDNKKRLNCFTNTDLEHLLRILGVTTVVLTGINTNTCVLNTAFSALDRDFAVVVISDCVASMYGHDLHVFALQNIARCIGWVLTVDEFKEKLKAGVRNELVGAAE
ncbi:MAG TPA: cysteine hydrolase [Actinomycetota bacterium]|nr:cysteine hydrolase [Actinomycetota bacterium]